MNILIILEMLGGLVLFLYGINVLGDALKKVSGGRLETILEKLTSNKWKAALLGLIVTAVIQSSGATIVMVVGFVNSEIMNLSQAVGVILGANVGTTVTAWLLSLTGIQSDNVILQLFKPAYFSPVVGLIGLVLVMAGKKERHKDVGTIMVAFAVLMLGMNTMSSAADPLANDPTFISILTMFSNPILGVLAGLVMTAVLQSSSASIGILQAISMSGTLQFSSAIPVLMGENIGSAITGVISSIGASRNARRAAMMQMYFCLIKTFVFMIVFYALNAVVHFSFMNDMATPFSIAIFHSIFNLTAVVIMLPFSELLVKLVMKTIPETGQEIEDKQNRKPVQILDQRFLASPAFALEQAKEATNEMAKNAVKAMDLAMGLIGNYNEADAQRVSQLEELTDEYDDQLGTYLVQLSSKEFSTTDSHMLSTLFHAINDFERIADHALNIMQYVQEMDQKELEFSTWATEELSVFRSAVHEILDMASKAFINNNLTLAKTVEPLEDVIDGLNMELNRRHVRRLRTGQCTIELGLELSNITTDMERVADHCSNIAVAMLSINEDGFDTHEYLQRERKLENDAFHEREEIYEYKYKLPKMEEYIRPAENADAKAAENGGQGENGTGADTELSTDVKPAKRTDQLKAKRKERLEEADRKYKEHKEKRKDKKDKKDKDKKKKK